MVGVGGGVSVVVGVICEMTVTFAVTDTGGRMIGVGVTMLGVEDELGD